MNNSRASRGASVLASGLVKRFTTKTGTVTALAGLDLDVPEGTVLGLLGPNGAGKTTAVSILTTLLEPDEGQATVAGADVRTEPAEVRRRIGLSGQYAAVDEILTGFENLDMIGRLYRLGRKRSRARADELLERFSLADAANRPVKTYSGGMRRRLDLAGALVAEPPVIFLDEPTTGLDPRSRLDLWEIIRELVDRGTTLLLTTQYLEEADQLADDIVVIDHGLAIAHGTADQLKAQVGGERIEVVVAQDASLDEAAAVLKGVAVGEVEADPGARRLLAPVSTGADALADALAELRSRGIDIHDIGLRRPTLDDVFLTLTGHATEHETDHETKRSKP
jgi:ABC-2 type transport system ATP-binding protein